MASIPTTSATRRRLLATIAAIAAVPAIAVYAEGFTEPYWIGRTLWIKPAREAFRQIEFYTRPGLNNTSFVVNLKREFKIEGVYKGWVHVRFLQRYAAYGEAFVPLGVLRRFIYRPPLPSRLEYDRAAFFEEDPDVVLAEIERDEVARKGKRDSKRIDPLQKYRTWEQPSWKQSREPPPGSSTPR